MYNYKIVFREQGFVNTTGDELVIANSFIENNVNNSDTLFAEFKSEEGHISYIRRDLIKTIVGTKL